MAQGLLEDYMIPSALPNFDVSGNPDEEERARWSAIARLGLGVAGRQPLPQAMDAAYSQMMKDQANSRAEGRANMEMRLKQHKAKQEWVQDFNNARLLSSLEPSVLRAKFNMPDEVINAIKYAKDPVAAVGAYKAFFEPRTMSPGQVERVGNEVTFAMPGNEGQQYRWGPKGATEAGFVPGAPQVQQRLAESKAYGTGQGAAPFNVREAPVPGRPNATQMTTDAQLITEARARENLPPMTGMGFESAAPQAAAPAAAPAAAAPAVTGATLTMAQKHAAVLQKELADESNLLAQAFAAKDETKIRQHTKNIEAITPELAKWQKTAGIPVAAAAPAPAAAPERVKYAPAPEGFSRTPDGSLQRDAGGPKDDTFKEQSRIQTALEKGDEIFSLVKEAKGMASPFNTGAPFGWLGAHADKIPGDMQNLKGALSAIKSNIGFGILKQMREESASGASGLGQLAIYELEQLQNSIGSLDQAQTEGQLKKNLERVEHHYTKLRAELRRQYKVQQIQIPGSAAKGAEIRPRVGATGGWDEDPLDMKAR